jgi:hypothetical protein
MSDLARLAAEVDDLRARIACLEAQRRPFDRLARADRERLARILPAIAAELGSEPFLISELAGPGVAVACAGLSPRRLGRLLLRGAGLAIDGHMVERVGDEGGCALWSVRKVVSGGFSDSETTQLRSVRRRATAS